MRILIFVLFFASLFIADVTFAENCIAKSGVTVCDKYFIPSTSSDYNDDLAGFLALVSDEVYKEEQMDRTETLRKFKFESGSTNFYNGKDNTQVQTALRYIQGKRIILTVFRGTDFSKIMDVLTNLNIFKTDWMSEKECDNKKPQVHKGFNSALSGYIDSEVHHKIINDYENTDIFVITGHSLGGALATLYYAYLHDNGVKDENILVYTFGAPSVGDKCFFEHYKNGKNFHRIRNIYDPVPFLAYLAFILNDNALKEKLEELAKSSPLSFYRSDKKKMKAARKTIFKKILGLEVVDKSIGAFNTAVKKKYTFRHIGKMRVYKDGNIVKEYESMGIRNLIDIFNMSEHYMKGYLANFVCKFSDAHNDKKHKWFEEPTKILCKLGIVKGYEDENDANSFKPGQSVNRAEFLKMVLLASDKHKDHEEFYEDYRSNTVSVDDVPSDEWYSGFVKYALSEGIVEGYPPDKKKFKPYKYITRAEAAKILVKGFNFNIENSKECNDKNKAFPDLDCQAWYYNYVHTLKREGIVAGFKDGDDEGNFKPGKLINRAGAVKMVCEAVFPEDEHCKLPQIIRTTVNF